jgi:AMMECR1 domain-containing protein
VSLLSASESVEAVDEQDLIARLRPGVDGLVIEYGRHRATFLPQVWEALGQPRQFLAALKRKAGLPEGFWSERMSFERYRVTKWAESDFLASEARR